jgi:succinoglycan biosynthesis protein ExoM
VSAVQEQAAGVPGVSILVVDNDPEQSAMPLREELAGSCDLRIVHEPTPGIVAARNRALDECTDADVLVFIDDDELPQDGWLRSMLATWERTGAAAVAGPVVSTFEEQPDPFVVGGAFFVRRRLPTGTELDVAATGNLLLDICQVRRAGVRFDSRFALSGGSDSLFTRELHRRGGRMVWCDEAVVTDVVPASRANRSWVLRRAVRTGNTISRVELALAEGPVARLWCRVVLVGRGLARLVGGSARAVLGFATGSVVHRAGGARSAWRGVGMIGGSLGYTREEYRRV